ncbi:uncharacterized protein LOC121257280 isoform X2 [Juglans microcarpa x Juglans regia]|uniref:uncharacterized protein LOC121257280 isoform X2 n=1 Tax=Juglans microcarpa x Juglans regia TaxID=2249226 RepID=UPI001B7F6774|nr:uncharacterized protein LOC121257280 isoform X2 [Juglans microcarpa x Juglans regia]
MAWAGSNQGSSSTRGRPKELVLGCVERLRLQLIENVDLEDKRPLEKLWLGKAHIPRLMQIRGLSKLVAYSLAVTDGKRNRIMKDDLCDHAWEFHFNKTWPAHKSHVCHLGLQNIGEILILIGRVQAHPCAATSIQTGAKVQIQMTKYGAVMNAVT